MRPLDRRGAPECPIRRPAARQARQSRHSPLRLCCYRLPRRTPHAAPGAGWKNRGLLKSRPYHVSNQCSEYGKVVAKVDLVSARDRTIQLTGRIPRDGDTRHRIRGISCCSDMGICNRSNVVTDERCLARFLQASSAAASCRHYTATAEARENYRCAVTAECYLGRDAFRPLYRTSSIAVPWLDLDDVQNCRGVLIPAAES